MSRTVIGYSGRTPIYRDEGPNTATLRARGGLALGQVLTASPPSQIKPVAETRLGRPPGGGLRGEVLLEGRKGR